jgi:hypothetical protein
MRPAMTTRIRRRYSEAGSKVGSIFPPSQQTGDSLFVARSRYIGAKREVDVYGLLPAGTAGKIIWREPEPI